MIQNVLMWHGLRMADERVEIHLVYHGPDVTDGSMSIEDIIPVLQGFSSAYGKLAASTDPETTHRIRITGVNRGSADITLEVWKAIPGALAGAVIGTFAKVIIEQIIGVIALKRHTKRLPFTEKINATNSIVITNSENVTIEVPLAIYEHFKTGVIDNDLNKIVRPLETDHIDTAEIRVQLEDNRALNEKITSEEKPYFDVQETTVVSTTPVWLVAKLNSFTKTTNSGWLWLSDGSRVFYNYVGDDPIRFLSMFSYNGPVKILCIAQMDANLKVNRVDASNIVRTQSDLFPDLETPPK